MLLKKFIKQVLNENDDMNKQRSFFVKILRNYVNVDAFTETPTIPSNIVSKLRDFLDKNPNSFKQPKNTDHLYRGISFNEPNFHKFMKTINVPFNVNDKEGTAKNVILTGSKNVVSSWTDSPITASEYSAAGNFDGEKRWYEVVLETIVQNNPPNTFISLKDDEFHNLKNQYEYYGGESESLALGPVNCIKLQWYKVEPEPWKP